MYPLSIKLHGIRDFAPRRLDLGAPGHDVLIGGKNGSGKSTLVYAMSFALVSAKVSVDGLRSKLKRRVADPWQARVGILFHNPPGREQKDGPEYVELLADVNSPAGSERKYITYALWGGEVPDKLQLLRKFTSRREAYEYYRNVFDIDSDGYFMFWYQGSIADFANIPDAVRFQRVAEMFKLDDIQREWLAARVEMKRAEEEFEEAKNIALNRKRRLHELEKFKNALLQRDEERRQGLLLLTAGWKALGALVQQEEDQARERLRLIEEECVQLAGKRDQIDRQIKEKQDALAGKEGEQEIMQGKITDLKISLRELADLLKQWQDEREVLQNKVAAIEEKMKYIHRSREELFREKGQLENSIATLEQTTGEGKVELRALEQQQSQLYKTIGALEQQRQTGEELWQQLRHDHGELPGAVTLARLVAEKTANQEDMVRQEGLLLDSVRIGQQELARLEGQKTLLLPEQEQVMEIYRRAGIQAVAFGELFEVRSGANREIAEKVLGPLKHTIFVGQPLPRVSWERSFYVVPVDEWSKGGLLGRIEKNHQLEAYLQLVPEVQGRYKAEFIAGIQHWLAQVILAGGGDKRPTRNKLVLRQGILWDSFGARGMAAPGEAIGVGALEMARQQARDKLEQSQKHLQDVQARLARLREELQRDREFHARRQEIDRKMPRVEKDLAMVNEKLKQANENLTVVEQEIKTRATLLRRQEQELDGKKQLLKQVDGELAVYDQYEREAVSISRIKELNRIIEKNQNQFNAKQKQNDVLAEQLENLIREMKEIRLVLDGQKDQLDSLDKDLERKEIEKKKARERVDTLDLEAGDYRNKLKALQAQYQVVIQETTRLGRWLEPVFSGREINRDNLTRKIKEGQDLLQNAENTRVDEEAQEKYDDYLYEYEVASKELEESQLRFKQLLKKEEEQRDRYDKAVYLRWQRTNRLFSAFMERLGMVGEIRSLPPEQESRHQDYRWELHVSTRVGHRPEKVNPESGKIVGEGISGGERAAVSLVFALALLCDIQNRPPFYVLDEFDSALDEERKHEIFDLYKEMLQRKLVVISPKVHGDRYLDRFGKFHCVVANPGLQKGQSISEVYDVTREEYVDLRLEQEDEA